MKPLPFGVSLDVALNADVPPGEIWFLDADGRVCHRITGLQVSSRDANPLGKCSHHEPGGTGTAPDGLDWLRARQDIGQLGCDPSYYPDRTPKQDVPPKPAAAPTPPAFSEMAKQAAAEVTERLRQADQATGSAPAPRVLDSAMLDTLRGIMDATYWARSFLAVVRWKPEIATDYDTMLTWFANAIMTGYDKGRKVGKG